MLVRPISLNMLVVMVMAIGLTKWMKDSELAVGLGLVLILLMAGGHRPNQSLKTLEPHYQPLLTLG